MSLGFFNLDADVQKIVDAHKNDFNYDTADSYLKKKGGYKAYNEKADFVNFKL